MDAIKACDKACFTVIDDPVKEENDWWYHVRSVICFGRVRVVSEDAERLAFPWLSYNDNNMTAPKKMPVILVETMNGKPMMNNSNDYGSMENCISNALGKPWHAP